MVKKVNTEEFKKEVLESKGIVLVDWCGLCKLMGPVMEEVSESYTVFKVNVDDDEELATEYGIMSIPCIIAFKDGKEIARSFGYKPKEAILELVK